MREKNRFLAQLPCSVCICSYKAGFCVLAILSERLHYLIIRVTPTFTRLPPPINLTGPVLYKALLNYPALCSIQISFQAVFPSNPLTALCIFCSSGAILF